ncbi:MAG: c-type cytochrome [Chloroflexota bacterium]
MKRFLLVTCSLLVLMLFGTSLALAGGMPGPRPDLVEGAQLYDKWYAALGTDAPQGDMPIWGRQSGNTRSGAETWRCAECHGWDYQGAQGAYAAGSHATGFPGLLAAVADMDEADILLHLKGGNDQQHDFSPYIPDNAMQKIAVFLKEGLIDDSEYIHPLSLKVIDGDQAHGKELYEAACATCHGADGRQIIFRGEGVDETLADVANRDPFRFLHRTRFGVAGTEMPVGYELGWTPADGRDALMYAQSLARGKENAEVTGAGQGSGESGESVPTTNLWTGILTGIGAFFVTFGSALLILTGLVVVGAAVVFALRRRN